MAIQTELQGGNFGFPLDFAGGFEQLGEQILVQRQYPEKTRQKLVQTQQYSSPTQCVDSHGVSFVVEMQRQQMDQFLKFQSERFRLVLHEKRNEQMSVLLKNIEVKTRFLFRQKDEEIARAKKRRIELEGFLTKLQMENQERQRVVQENEAMVASLTNMLEQVRERASSCFYNGVNDAESINRDDDAAIDPKNKTMICRICNSRISCVLLLPCRHLCSCTPCEKSLDSCPVCNTTKKASIEAVIF